MIKNLSNPINRIIRILTNTDIAKFRDEIKLSIIKTVKPIIITNKWMKERRMTTNMLKIFHELKLTRRRHISETILKIKQSDAIRGILVWKSNVSHRIQGTHIQNMSSS